LESSPFKANLSSKLFILCLPKDQHGDYSKLSGGNVMSVEILSSDGS